MDTSNILTELYAERERINQAITALEALDGTALPQHKAVQIIAPVPAAKPTFKKRVISAESRKKMAEAQRKRWSEKKTAGKPSASVKRNATTRVALKSAKNGITAAGRKRISEAAKKRWAEKKAAAAKEA
jgi:hypothetical protein